MLLLFAQFGRDFSFTAVGEIRTTVDIHLAIRVLQLVILLIILIVLIVLIIGVLHSILLLLKRIQVGADVQSGLGAYLLLLVQGDLVVELLQKQLRIVQNAGVVIFVIARARVVFSLLLVLQHLLLAIGKSRQLVVEVVPVEQCLNRISSQVSQVFFEFGVL